MPYILTAALAVLMVVQSLLGLLVKEQYRDVEWIKATWFGNDWVTLVVAVPLLVVAVWNARRGSVQGVLLWLGLIGYAVYNYAYYVFGAALNVFFPLWLAIGATNRPGSGDGRPAITGRRERNRVLSARA